MLQQTRVETVIPYYHNFMTLFPTISALAAAQPSVVLKAWQGLGYYSRARNLHAAAQQIVGIHKGEVPQEIADFRSLPGVGPYTAGAVFSIAFNEPVPAVDGNVLRVMSRFLGIHEPIEQSSVKQRIAERVTTWLSETQPRDATQALMELGATLCVPKSPTCPTCPLQLECVAFATGAVEQLPVRLPKRPRKVVAVHALWCESEGTVLMQQRPASGLLASMWQLPNVELPQEDWHGAVDGDTDQVQDVLRAKMSELWPHPHDWVVAEEKRLDFAPIATEKHLFTHVEWHVTVYRPVGRPIDLTTCHAAAGLPTPRREIVDLVLPRVYEKLIQHIVKG